MNLRVLGIVTALFGMTPVYAAVNISLPEELKIVAVNDQEVTSSILRSNQNYQLDAGENSISVRYQEYFQHWDNSHDILKSGVVTLKTPALIDGQNYKLALVNAPKSYEDAQKYKDQPIVGLYDAKNQLIAQQAGIKDAAKPLFGTIGFGESVDLTTKKQEVAPVVAAVNTPTVTNVNTRDVELIELWKKANQAERQKFMSWLGSQSK